MRTCVAKIARYCLFLVSMSMQSIANSFVVQVYTLNNADVSAIHRMVAKSNQLDTPSDS